MSKEESLIPNIDDFVSDSDTVSIEDTFGTTEYLYTKETVMSILREFGEVVRNTTLEVASEKARSEIVYNSDDEVNGCEVIKSSILSLNTHPKLEIR